MNGWHVSKIYTTHYESLHMTKNQLSLTHVTSVTKNQPSYVRQLSLTNLTKSQASYLC
jgi:hypothetical protein